MWTRSELKARAKASIKANYWQCLLVCIVIAVLAGNFISVEYNLDYQEFTLNSVSYTHLDVYKRQIHNSRCDLQNACGIFNNHT